MPSGWLADAVMLRQKAAQLNNGSSAYSEFALSHSTQSTTETASGASMRFNAVPANQFLDREAGGKDNPCLQWVWLQHLVEKT